MNDNYLSSEYARSKEIECYDIEWREKNITGSGLPDNNRPDMKIMVNSCPDSMSPGSAIERTECRK